MVLIRFVVVVHLTESVRAMMHVAISNIIVSAITMPQLSIPFTQLMYIIYNWVVPYYLIASSMEMEICLK